MSEKQIRCTVTRYSPDETTESTEVETTVYHVVGGYLYLRMSAASAPVADLLSRARDGRGWLAQGPGSYLHPRIFVPAQALLEVLEP